MSKKYKLGIMSSVWYVEAPNVDVAALALIFYTSTTAPIANYTSNKDGSQEQSRFFTAGIDGSLPRMVGEFIAAGDNAELVKKAYKSIDEAV